MLDNIALRPSLPEDNEFLYRVYASTRENEYRAYFPQASYDVVQRGALPIGRLFVDRREDEIRIIDIALLPEHRNLGIGSRLLRRLLEEGDSTFRPVRIHVERDNPAMRLYERLGFQCILDRGVYLLMERSPSRRSHS